MTSPAKQRGTGNVAVGFTALAIVLSSTTQNGIGVKVANSTNHWDFYGQFIKKDVFPKIIEVKGGMATPACNFSITRSNKALSSGFQKFIMEDLLNPYLRVRTSTLPGAGKGLFTTIFIPKGMMVTEHTGKIVTMKEATLEDDNNAYLFYVNRNHVIDGKADKKMVARYINDAMGFTRVPGHKNNAQYVVENKRAFIVAKKDIPAGSEIFVSYGKDYWTVLKKILK